MCSTVCYVVVFYQAFLGNCDTAAVDFYSFIHSYIKFDWQWCHKTLIDSLITWHVDRPSGEGLIKSLDILTLAMRGPVTLLVNDFTHHSTVGDCQHANNVYRLTPHTEAAIFSDPPASGSVTFIIHKHLIHTKTVSLYALYMLSGNLDSVALSVFP